MTQPPRYVERLVGLPRALGILALHPDGLPLTVLADELGVEVTALRETILEMARDCGPDRLAEQTEVAIHRADSRPRLTAIAVPTMVLAGEHEQLCPLDAHREIADRIPGAKFHVIKDAGRFAPLENPDASIWETVARLVSEAMPLVLLRIRPDLQGTPRAVIAARGPEAPGTTSSE